MADRRKLWASSAMASGTTVRAWVCAAADLFLGAECAGCGQPALTLCARCRNSLLADPREIWPHPTPELLRWPSAVTPFAAGPYTGPLRAALAQFKEHGQFGLLPVLSQLLAASISASDVTAAMLLVPVPSSARAKRERGYDAVDQLASASASLLRREGKDCVARQVLRHRRTLADQSGLSAVERWQNLHHAFVADGRRIGPGRSIVVVDDILTTGATVCEAVRALTTVGHRPVAIATVAATIRKNSFDFDRSGPHHH